MAEARLIASDTHFIPGETQEVGISFDIAKGWHLYGNGSNDTGYPPRVRVELPAGYTAGEIQWPAPHRKTAPGDILDHIYEKQVTLLLPVTVPLDAEPGSTAKVTVGLDWLVCREACIPESDTVSLALPVAQAGSARPRTAGEAARRMDRARERIPAEAGSELACTWDGATLVIEAAGASAMYFYPAADSPPTTDLTADGAATGGRMAVRFSEDGLVAPVRGVVEVVYPDRSPGFYHLRAPAPGPKASD